MGNLILGKHPVGFKTVSFADSTRNYGQSPRPILCSIWYPATETNNKRLKFKELIYVDGRKISLKSLSDSRKNQIRDAFLNKIVTRGASLNDLGRLLETSLPVYEKAPHISEEFPLVITSQGGGRPAYTQFILNQYLASHGFIVCSFADIRSSPNRSETTVKSDMESLAGDIKDIVNWFKNESNFAISSIGGIAFSKSGEAMLLNEMVETQFNALAMLDAQPGKDALTYLPNHQLVYSQVPILAIFSNHQNKLTIKETQKDTSAFSFMQFSDKLLVRFMEANHGDLTSASILGYLIENYNRWPAFGRSKLSYETLCEIVLNFFNRYLKYQESEREVLRIFESLPKDFLIFRKIEK